MFLTDTDDSPWKPTGEIALFDPHGKNPKTGMHGSPGIGHFDSNMVDSAGNVYQCVNEDGEILVWNEHGDLLETVKIKQNLGAPEMSATNLAIKPGTKTAYGSWAENSRHA